MTFDVAAGRYCADWAARSATTRHARETERNMARLVDWIGPATLLTDITDDLVARLVARRRADEKVNAAGRSAPQALAPLGRVIERPGEPVRHRAAAPGAHRGSQGLEGGSCPTSRTGLSIGCPSRASACGSCTTTRSAPGGRGAVRLPRPAPVRAITGVRRREVASLTWRQVDFEARSSASSARATSRTSSPITPDLHALLWPLRDQHETAVFTYLCPADAQVRHVGP